MLKIKNLETGYGKKQVLFGLSIDAQDNWNPDIRNKHDAGMPKKKFAHPSRFFN